LAVIGGEYLVLTSGCPTSDEKAYSTHWTGEAIGSITGMVSVPEGKFFTPAEF
jgi:hypothetical protein